MASHPESCGSAVTTGGYIPGLDLQSPVADIRRLSFKMWSRGCSERLKSMGLLHYVRGGQTGPPRRMEGESDNALALRRRQHFEHAELARQVILGTLPPHMRYICRDVGPASELWLHLKDKVVGLNHLDRALAIWSRFTQLEYDLGKSQSDIKNFCAKYQETVELCKGENIVLDPKVQSFQFMDNLKEYFPEWYREKEHLVLEYSQAISKTSQTPKLEDLVKVVVFLATQAIESADRGCQ